MVPPIGIQVSVFLVYQICHFGNYKHCCALHAIADLLAGSELAKDLKTRPVTIHTQRATC